MTTEAEDRIEDGVDRMRLTASQEVSLKLTQRGEATLVIRRSETGFQPTNVQAATAEFPYLAERGLVTLEWLNDQDFMCRITNAGLAALMGIPFSGSDMHPATQITTARQMIATEERTNMSRKHYAKDTICIEATGLSIELDVSVSFTVTDYRPQSLTFPEEPCMVEDVDLEVTRNGKPVSMPVWLIEEISENDGFKDWLLGEASESDLAAREDAAEARRDEISFQSFVL